MKLSDDLVVGYMIVVSYNNDVEPSVRQQTPRTQAQGGGLPQAREGP